MGKLQHLMQTEDMAYKMAVIEAAEKFDALKEVIEKAAASVNQNTIRALSQLPEVEIPEPTDYSGDLARLATQLGNVSDMIRNIKFPAIPEPERVNLDPIFTQLNALMAKVDNIDITVPPAVPTGKREFVHEVQYNNFGGIERVVSREV